jgi:hypothetical protein
MAPTDAGRVENYARKINTGITRSRRRGATRDFASKAFDSRHREMAKRHIPVMVFAGVLAGMLTLYVTGVAIE